MENSTADRLHGVRRRRTISPRTAGGKAISLPRRATQGSGPSAKVVVPNVLLVFQPRVDAANEILKGIVQFQRTNRAWSVSLFDEMQLGIDPGCWAQNRTWQGVINRSNSPRLVQTCLKRGVPVVDLADSPPVSGVPKLRPDNRAVGETGAVYFLKRRFRDFGFCGYSNQTSSQERCDGFVNALGRSRHRCEIFDVECPAELTPTWEAGQIALLAAWLRQMPKGVAVMACNDRRAQQIVRAAHLAGLRVPEDVAVLGVGNDETCCELADPTISSIDLNLFEVGRRAAEVLMGLIAGEKIGHVDVRIEPIGVVTRKSTDILGTRDEIVAAALDYIREHACEGITVSEVLRHVPISRTSLECKLRRYISRSPQAEIRRIQMAKICELLTETNLSLKEIAHRTGFVHVEYMCVVFKRITGTTPGRYRRTNAQKFELPATTTVASSSRIG